MESSKKDERIDFYLEYFKNLTPDGFNIKKEADKIVIEL